MISEDIDKRLWTYRCWVRDVYDGDTIRVDFDLGLDFKAENQRVRLIGVNTPEIKGRRRRAGIAARDFVRERILSRPVILQTQRDAKGRYGRWLATCWYRYAESGPWTNLNAELLDTGHAEPME